MSSSTKKSHTPLLQIDELSVDFVSAQRRVRAVDKVSLELDRGDTLGIVGESGSGKSVLCQSIMRLLDSPPCEYPEGRILFNGQDLLGASEKRLRELRGNAISMVFQEPMTALNPFLKIGAQLIEPLLIHHKGSSWLRRKPSRAFRQAALARACELLDRVGIAEPKQCLQQYPHELSGGMRQRVLIATALIGEPDLLIADEPTTALDVTVQIQIIELLRSLQRELGFATLFVSHDFLVIRQVCDRLVVMKQGKQIETGDCNTLLAEPSQPYTRELIAAASLSNPLGRETGHETGLDNSGPPLLSVNNLTVVHAGNRADSPTVSDISFELQRGEVLALVGESGSGKSTVCQAVMQLLPLHSGNIRFDGQSLQTLPANQLQALRARFQLVFQDPYASLNPRMTLFQALAEPLQIHRQLSGAEAALAVGDLLTSVELDPSLASCYPHQLSGGQRQRVAIARALASEPALLIADEPVSALDVTVQEKILQLLARLCQQRNISLLMVSHDLGVVRRLADRIAVMYSGRLLEIAATETLFTNPAQEYTRELLYAYQQLLD